MALIKCKECGSEVSSKADACPKCGAPFKLRVKGPSGCMMILTVIVATIGLLWFVLDASDSTKKQEIQNNNISNAPKVEKKELIIENPELKEQGVNYWYQQEEINKVTGLKSYFLFNRSINSVDFGFPYNEVGGSKLTIIFRESKDGLDGYVTISKGQMICGYSDCSIRTRGDDGKLVKWSANRESSGRSDMIFLSKPKEFKKYLNKNKKIVIGITFYKSGEQAFEFNVSNFPDINK